MSADTLSVKNAIINGENLITKVLNFARQKSPTLPHFDITLKKFFPTGSGIGAGSGNAAALLDFLATNYGLDFSLEALATLGADIPFLAQHSPLALVRGVGEIVEPLDTDLQLSALLLFPDWQINTAEAYRKIDAAKKNTIVTDKELVARSLEIISLLQAKKQVGLLPNDFWQIAREHHSEYDILAREASIDSMAYGLSGSGSCFFALFDSNQSAISALNHFKKYKFITKGQVI